MGPTDAVPVGWAETRACLQLMSVLSLRSPRIIGKMVPNMVWGGLIVCLWGLPVWVVRMSCEPSLTGRALHFQELEMFFFLWKTEVWASPCGLRARGPTTALPVLPCLSLDWRAIGEINISYK